jgi:large subunit ribosomal protein L4
MKKLSGDFLWLYQGCFFMAQATVYNQEGQETGKADLPKEIFEVALNSDLVHQVAVAQMANRRQGSSHTKDRGAVSGGGKKPWRQKGTGRARHGSNRSPIWRSGGVTFGPTKERNYSKQINAKMRRKALFMVLSEKAKQQFVLLLDDVKFETPKTKKLAALLDTLPCKDTSVLIALPGMEKNFIQSARNIKKVQAVQAKDLNTLDALNVKYVVMPKQSLDVMKETWL